MGEKRNTTAEVLDIFDALLSSVDHAERAGLSASERVVLMGKARRVQDRVASLASVLTAEVNRSQSSLTSTGTPLTSLIALEEGRDSHDAAQQVFQAQDLSAHEMVKEAALAGTVSSRHAAAIGKGMAQLPPELNSEQKARAQMAFLERAPRNTPRALTALSSVILAEVAPEFVESEDQHHTKLERQRKRAIVKRSLVWGDDGDGSTWLRGSLPHLEAAPLIRIVEAYVECDRRAARERMKATRATGAHRRTIAGQASDDIARTPEQRRADALTQLLTDHRDAPSSVGDRPRIVVTVRAQDLRDRAEQAGVLARGVEITAGDLRRLCCDADLMPVVLGGPSEVLDVGQTQRLVTPAIRRALTVRDGGCIFPHCSAPDTACEAHHIRPWWAGGATALSNLALLCRHHHALVEPDRYNAPADRWRIRVDGSTGKPVVTAPERVQRLGTHLSAQSVTPAQAPEDMRLGDRAELVAAGGLALARHGP